MRDRFEAPKPGEQLSSESANQISRVAEVLSGKHPSGFTHGRHNSAQSTESPPAEWTQVLIEITNDSLKSNGLYQGKIIGYDRLEEERDDRWQKFGNELTIDATGYGKTGDDWSLELSVEKVYPCYWDSQRGSFIPICCGFSPTFTCIIYKDYFDFITGSPIDGVGGSVADPDIIPGMNPPSKDDTADDEWFVVREHWRRRQELEIFFNDGVDTIVGIPAPPSITDGIGGFQYNGYAEAINGVIGTGLGSDPEDWPVANSRPMAGVLRHHPLGISPSVVSAGIELFVAPRDAVPFVFDRVEADAAGVFLGYRGAPFSSNETEQPVDYYYALAVSGSVRDDETYPGKLQLWHFVGGEESEDDEDLLLAEVFTDDLLMDDLASSVGPVDNLDPPVRPIIEYQNRNSKFFFLDLCYFDGYLTATINRNRQDQSEGGEGRPGTGDVIVSCRCAAPRGDRVGILVEQMDRVSYADTLRFPIRFYQFEWWYHRDDELNPQEVCEFCLTECTVCEVDDTPLAYLIEIGGVVNNTVRIPDPRSGGDQCVSCGDDFNGLFIAHLQGVGADAGAGTDIPRGGCCYRAPMGCSEMADPCPPFQSGDFHPVTNPHECTTPVCFIEMCISGGGGGGGTEGLEARLWVSSWKGGDDAGAGPPNSQEFCDRTEATLGDDRSDERATPVGLVKDMVANPVTEKITCRNGEFSGRIGQTSFEARVGSGGQMCMWSVATFIATPLFEEDFDDDGKLNVDGEQVDV